MPRISLRPSGVSFPVAAGTDLADHLFAHGVEFPCGGRGRCRGCRVRVLDGHAAITADDQRIFSAADLAAGWRLACRCRAEGDLVLELAQWTAAILGDDRAAPMAAGDGCGIAIDLGSTTLVAQLVDRRDGAVLGVRSALNPQARHGGDLMSRIGFAQQPGGAATLRDLVRSTLGGMCAELAPLATAPIGRICIVGNTAMHHLFCGIGIAPLAAHPFEPVDDGLKSFTGRELGWDAVAGAEVLFLPCLGGFVGSDILAGILACGVHEAAAPVALIDLGTNGEIVVGSRAGMFCASTAAGPAFEGASISCGMRAVTGAIAKVRIADGALRADALGGGEPRGICGSGLVDAVAAGLALGLVRPNGRLRDRDGIPLSGPVRLVQQDVRELQLAKGAIAAGLLLCSRRLGMPVESLAEVHLAGAFGNAIDRGSAVAIGLLPPPVERIRAAGNSALRGARIALNAADPGFPDIRRRCIHHALKADPGFEDAYIEQMGFTAP